MKNKITVAIEMADAGGVKALLEALDELAEVEIIPWFKGSRDQGGGVAKVSPAIIIIDDQPESSSSAGDRMARLRQSFPQAAIFVVSADTRPEHIVGMMKSGAAQYLVSPVDVKMLTDAIEEVRSRQSPSGKRCKGAVYSFISSKGGIGTTVISVNVAVALALARSRQTTVALCDMSLQAGDASVLLDLLPATTIADLSRNMHRLDLSFLRGAMSSHRSGLAFLPAPGDPEESEDVSAEHVARILELARQIYDIVVIDCASMRVDDRTMEIFSHSDQIFVVTDLSVPAVRNSVRLCTLIEKMGVAREKIAVVVNRYLKGGALSTDEVEKTLKRRISWLFPNDFKEIVSSINHGEALVEKEPGAPFSRNVMEFADKLGNPHADPSYRGIRGTFGKAL